MERHRGAAPACFRATGFITAPFCVQCAKPVVHAGQLSPESLCADCLADPPPWARARAALRYDPQTRRLVLPLKQSAGTACEARVKSGDRVNAGQIIGEPAPKALGAILHAPMAGIVREVNSEQIILEKS